MNSQRRFTRSIDGILLLDKPCHITSNAALQTVKHLFAAQKAGHTGSLDPLATGMLPICFGEATKFSQFLLEADKRYRVTARLGIKTSTGDAEGEIIQERSAADITEAKLLEILPSFRGPIQQVPSMFSALKHQGRPLYELARKGITIEREARTVFIHELVLLSITENSFSLEIVCSKGTYIRTLVEDMGEVLGCGAHVSNLRRLTTGAYLEHEMINMQNLEQMAQEKAHEALDMHLLPIDTALRDWPIVKVSEAATFYLTRGQAVIIPQTPTSGLVRLMLNGEKFVGVGEILDNGKVAPRRLLSRL